MTQFSNLSNTSWFVFDKIYATTNDFDPNYAWALYLL